MSTPEEQLRQAGADIIDYDPHKRKHPKASETEPPDVSPEFSDDALALEFTKRHRSELRYVATMGKWFWWNGKVWLKEETLEVFDMARKVARDFANSCRKPQDRKNIASSKTVYSIEKLARADRRHAATADQWDADPLSLNTPGGIIDLRTGKLYPHDADAYCTKITAVAPGGNCPIWLQFLRRITGGNDDLISFLQRICGYCLTGTISEHAFFFGYGTGGNGKGVYLNTMTGVIGNYATVASMETFTSTQSDKHPTDLAMLHGARLVTAQETEEGRQWAESRIKAITGGDAVSARFMHKDFFTYHPQFKLFVAGNHKPQLRNVDDAIQRRLHIIPFEQTISAAERDPDLTDKLKEEWPGVLQWMIDGCLAWRLSGLAAPTAVKHATAEYFEAEDAVATWLAECTQPSNSYEFATDLFASWKRWAEKSNEVTGSQKRFSQALVSKGYAKILQPGTKRALFERLRLMGPDYSEKCW